MMTRSPQNLRRRDARPVATHISAPIIRSCEDPPVTSRMNALTWGVLMFTSLNGVDAAVRCRIAHLQDRKTLSNRMFSSPQSGSFNRGLPCLEWAAAHLGTFDQYFA